MVGAEAGGESDGEHDASFGARFYKNQSRRRTMWAVMMAARVSVYDWI